MKTLTPIHQDDPISNAIGVLAYLRSVIRSESTLNHDELGIIETTIADLKAQKTGLQEDFYALLGERDAIWAATSSDSVDAYLSALPWSAQATDWEKTLAAGNVRAFVSHLRRLASGHRHDGPAARLGAAAPDLLVALKNAIRCCYEADLTDGDPASWLAVARRAVAKAEEK